MEKRYFRARDLDAHESQATVTISDVNGKGHALPVHDGHVSTGHPDVIAELERSPFFTYAPNYKAPRSAATEKKAAAKPAVPDRTSPALNAQPTRDEPPAERTGPTNTTSGGK